jgi:peptidoglycan/LPS O-acetylase OafA/YrhL
MNNKLSPVQSAYLDLLRGIAAMMVLVGHAAVIFLGESWLARMHIEVLGVLIFFLLSGFLISYTALRRYHDPAYTFRIFFIDRFARIFTAFIPALALVGLADLYILHVASQLPPPTDTPAYQAIAGVFRNVSWQNWLGNLFMLQDFPLFQIARIGGVPDNPWFIRSFGSAGPFWTISIEWWLYMLFGMAVLVWLRQGYRLKLWQLPLLGFVAIEPLYYLVGGVNNCLTLLWVLGMLACIGFLHWPRWCTQLGWQTTSRNYWLGLLLIVLGGIGAMGARLLAIKLDAGNISIGEFQFSLFLAVVVFASVLLAGCVNRLPGWLVKVSQFLANYSFSLYLTHFTVLTYLFVRYPGSEHNPKLFLTSLVASNVLAIVFWWLFERHYPAVGRWLKRRYAARSGT